MLASVCKKRFISFLPLFLFSIPAFSASGHLYVGGSLGDGFASLSNSDPQISYNSGVLITDDYPFNNNRASSAIFSVNGGYEFAGLGWKPSIALGLGVYGNLADSYYNGQVIETADGDPSDTLFKYSFNVSSTRVMAEMQLGWTLGVLSPFVNFGVGPAWNKMNSYTETAITSTGYTPLPPFQGQNNVNFAYQAGLGVSTAFNFAGSNAGFAQERLSLGYRYVNLGMTSFGTRGVDYPYALNTGRLETNEVYLSYTHLF